MSDCTQHQPIVIEQESKTEFKGLARKNATVTIIKATKVKCFNCGVEEAVNGK